MTACPVPDRPDCQPAAATPDQPAGAWLRVDATGTLLQHNAAALRLLADQAALLRVHGNRLEAPQHAAALQQLLARAAAALPAALALARPDALPLTLRCEPDGAGNLLLTLQDPDSLHVDAALLQPMFGLTRAEARVACALAAGRSPQQMADVQGVQLNTVQAHLKAAMAKAGCRRQAQLVSLLLRSAALVGVHRGHRPALPQAAAAPALPPPGFAGERPSVQPHLARWGNDAAAPAGHTAPRACPHTDAPDPPDPFQPAEESPA